eukprot:1420828-Rhodomonas_salina.1
MSGAEIGMVLRLLAGDSTRYSRQPTRRVRCAVSGTAIAYGASTELCDVWYCNSVWCYYRAMRCAVLR